jgi:DNA-binding response OmpR family regulator
LAGRKVLVVEDEWVLARALQDTLDRWGCQVLGPFARATDAVAALADRTAPRPDLALLDLNLADGTSLPVAERLARLGVPFLLVSACGSLPRDAAAVLRAAPYLTKLVPDDQLRRAMRQSLAARRCDAAHPVDRVA